MIAIDPNIHEGEREEYLFHIKGSELNLYVSIFSDDANKYNEYLAKAIRNHRKYWGETENKRYTSQGWISYPLTAASVIAKDNMNYELKIDSPYVPIWLVNYNYNQKSIPFSKIKRLSGII